VEVTRSSPPVDPDTAVPSAGPEQFPSGYFRVDVDKLPGSVIDRPVVMIGGEMVVNLSV
jgi:hypothetical protein